MDFRTDQPIWLQAVELLRSDLVAGRLKPGEKLPGVRDLALRFGINPNTAARIYRELEDAGLSTARRGLGVFVTEDEEKIARLRRQLADEAVKGLFARLESLGYDRRQALTMIENIGGQDD